MLGIGRQFDLAGHMKRREFIAGLGVTSVWPIVARAQQPSQMRRVGILMGLPENDPDVPPRIAAFRDGLGKLGWTEGVNIQLEFRWAPGDAAGARAYATELVSLKPDAIVAQSTYIATALQRATDTIPIIFVQVVDPVGAKLVNSFSQPGGNITGFTNYEISLSGKWISLLRDIEPEIERIGVMYDPDTLPVYGLYTDHLEVIGPKLGTDVISSPFRNAAELEPIIRAFAGNPKSGLLVLPDVTTSKNRTTIIEAAAKYRLPSIYSYAHFPKDGGLMSYGVDPVDLFAKSAAYVDRILRGAKPAELPVQAPTQFQLVINRNTATSLGLAIPQTLLAEADEVIE
jgi:putative tryptophan/tyrosine transport system substrate-binding protein